MCGIKAEIAEPNIATPEEGFVGELYGGVVRGVADFSAQH